MYMENEEGASRPSIGFPLGIALLVVVLLCISGFFSCYYYWDKFRALLKSSSNFHDTPQTPSITTHAPSSPKTIMESEQINEGKSWTVLMPGDEVPKFIALPIPFEPPNLEKIIVKLSKSDFSTSLN